MTSLRTNGAKPPKNRRKRRQMLITSGVLMAMAIGLVIAVAPALRRPETVAVPQAENEPLAAPLDQAASPKEGGPQTVSDDGQMLWVSPTEGQPIDLRYLPPGCGLILHLRPDAIAAKDQAKRSFRALGPSASEAWNFLQQISGEDWNSIERLLVGVRAGSQTEVETVSVLRTKKKRPESEELPLNAEHRGVRYRLTPQGAIWRPPNQPEMVVIAPSTALHEIIDAAGAVPPLRRELEELLARSDVDRHLSLLLAPSFLFTGGKSLFVGGVQSLREPLLMELPDALQGALVSAHWDDRFYLELRAAPAAEVTELQLATLLDSRVRDWPAELQLALLDADLAVYGRRVVARLPAMARVLSRHSRQGVEKRHVVMNCYLPAPAGHNLALASELLLAQLSAVPGRSPTSPMKRPLAMADRLLRPVTIVFSRDTLEMAVQHLSEEIDAPIVILGGDLQLEGITKNQSFGLDIQELPAREALMEILRLANPDKSATGPTDSRQKLVYVVQPNEERVETLYVTTRAAAAQRGDPLPEDFQP